MSAAECSTGLTRYDSFENATRAALRQALIRYYVGRCNACHSWHIFEIATQIETRADPDVRYLSCTSKKAYSTEKMAKRVAQRVFDQRGVMLRVYRCTHCGFHHLTRQRDREEHHRW